MAVYDRWHKTQPKPGEATCKEHKLVPSGEHGKGKRWLVRYRDNFGEQQKKSFDLKVGKNPDIHAEAYDAKIKVELSTRTWIDPDKGKIPLKDILPEWELTLFGDLKTKSLKLGKVKGSIRPMLGNRTLEELTTNSNHIQRWINHLEQERCFKPNTVVGYRTLLVGILNFAVRRGYLNSNPLLSRDFVRLTSPDAVKITPYTLDELNRLREELPDDLKPILSLGSELGLRIGEIFALSPNDIMDHGVVHVGTQLKRVNKTHVFALPKRRKTRIVPLPKKTRKMLDGLSVKSMTLPWDSPNGKPVTIDVYLTRSTLGPFNAESVRRNWGKACGRAGIHKDRQGFHHLRHTYASRLLSSGVDIRALSEFLGHSDPGFTLRTYCHLQSSATYAARKAIDDVP